MEFGIGVNTGIALAGNVGGKERMEYTLIGDAVNLAKRLQENAAGGQILIAQATYVAVRDRVQVRPARDIQVKGRAATETTYELTGLLD